MLGEVSSTETPVISTNKCALAASAGGWESPRWSPRDRQQLGAFLELTGAARVDVGCHLQPALLLSEEHDLEWMKALRFSEMAEGK